MQPVGPHPGPVSAESPPRRLTCGSWSSPPSPGRAPGGDRLSWGMPPPCRHSRRRTSACDDRRRPPPCSGSRPLTSSIGLPSTEPPNLAMANLAAYNIGPARCSRLRGGHVFEHAIFTALFCARRAAVTGAKNSNAATAVVWYRIDACPSFITVVFIEIILSQRLASRTHH